MDTLQPKDCAWWAEQAQKLSWFEPWNDICVGEAPFIRWFVGGKINASFVCLDVHINAGRGNNIAAYWEDEQGTCRQVTYHELWRMTNYFAGLLQDHGVTAGDRVVVFMPMIPEALAAILATARLGAIHVVVFSGFGADALRERIEHVAARVVITADYDIRRLKIIPLKNIVDAALQECACVQNVIVCQRSVQTYSYSLQEHRDVVVPLKNAWVYDVPERFIEPVAMPAESPLFILYTSGSTGKPKGIMHATGGYLTYVYSTIRSAFGIDASSVYWCTADIGWITGHSYVVYGPLMAGASMVMFDGAPDTPNPSIWWKLIERYRVSVFYTAPTALRFFIKIGDDCVASADLSSLKVLGSVGEPLNAQVWKWFYHVVGNDQCPIIDTWWQTETGGFMIAPQVNLLQQPYKPGSVTQPLPGIAVDLVDEHGKSVPHGQKGFVVVTKPWPSMPLGLWDDAQGVYEKTYWQKFPGNYYAGDYALQDADGDFFMISRADEVLNIAGHRVGTAELESALLTHAAVAEAAVIGVVDDIKGEVAVVFVVLRDGFTEVPELKKELIKVVQERVGKFVAPSEVFFIQALPKTRSGKIMRRILKAMVLRAPLGDMSTLEDDAVLTDVLAVYQQFIDGKGL